MEEREEQNDGGKGKTKRWWKMKKKMEERD